MRISQRLLAVVVAAALLASCSGGSNNVSAGSKLEIVVAENFWGSIVSQLAGDHAVVTSIIVNPATDPHDYEATAGDARLIAQAQYVVYNGIGYDHWMNSLLDREPFQQSENPQRRRRTRPEAGRQSAPVVFAVQR